MGRVWGLLSLLLVSSLSAADLNVAVLYRGRTEVNREGLNFMNRSLAHQVGGVRFTYTDNPADISLERFQGVIVFSTGTTQGLDSQLESFVRGFSAKNRLLLISLLSRSPQLFVKQTPASASALGVDTLTSATTWGDSRFFGGTQSGDYGSPIDMHEDWIGRVATFLKGL